MYYEEFNIITLEQQLDKIEVIERKIEFISDEMLRCKKVIQDLQFEMNEHIPFEIKFSIKQNGSDPTVIELINRDMEIKKVVTNNILKTCKEELCKRNNHFLERAVLLREHFQTKFDLQVKSNSLHPVYVETENLYNNNERIIWMRRKEILFNLFAKLEENKFLSEYSSEEILSHFADEKQIPFTKGILHTGKFRWRESDSSFAVFVNELAKRNAIDDNEKFKVFVKHFLNKNGKPFRNLAQKKYYTENYSKTGNVIREILKSINLSILLICYNLLSSFMLE